jgi:hypothetical protein
MDVEVDQLTQRGVKGPKESLESVYVAVGSASCDFLDLLCGQAFHGQADGSTNLFQTWSFAKMHRGRPLGKD